MTRKPYVTRISGYKGKDTKPRVCMCCKKEFLSYNKYNRLCNVCNLKAEYGYTPYDDGMK